MNRRSLMTLLASLATTRGHSATADPMQTAVSIIQKQIDAGVLASAVLRVQWGTETFERAFGKATADSMFLLGSITKPFTAVAALVLADRGELRLSDRVVKFIPELSEGARKEITIEQLLVHTSGLPDQLPDNNALRARHASRPGCRGRCGS